MQLFESDLIQEKIKSFFINVLKNERLAHAYLFYGKAGSGMVAFAHELAKALNCHSDKTRPCNQCASCIKIAKAGHPDVKFVFPVSSQIKDEKRIQLLKEKTQRPYNRQSVSGHLNIAIDTIRELKKEAMYAPFEAQKRVFIISGIEYFSREAANSFLKLLEEPPENLILILISHDANALLDTIRSRCQPVAFPPFSEHECLQIIKQQHSTEDDYTALIRIHQYNIEEILERVAYSDEDLRPLVVEFIRAVAKANWEEITRISEFFVQKRDKQKVLEFIELLLLWISDAFRYKAVQNNTLVLNVDMEDVIANFANHYTDTDYEKLISIVEQGYKDIKMNLNISITLTHLAIAINKNLKRQN